MKNTYIEVLELLHDRVNNLINQQGSDIQYDTSLINLRFDVKQMLLRLKKQKTKMTNQQVQDIVDLKLRLKKLLRSNKNG